VETSVCNLLIVDGLAEGNETGVGAVRGSGQQDIGFRNFRDRRGTGDENSRSTRFNSFVR
jgi:hypothetical protein